MVVREDHLVYVSDGHPGLGEFVGGRRATVKEQFFARGHFDQLRRPERLRCRRGRPTTDEGDLRFSSLRQFTIPPQPDISGLYFGLMISNVFGQISLDLIWGLDSGV